MGLNKKLDVVSVRLLPNELEILQQKATEEGFTSLSAYIRSCLRKMIGTAQTDEQSRLVMLEATVRRLEERLRHLESDDFPHTDAHPDGKTTLD